MIIQSNAVSAAMSRKQQVEIKLKKFLLVV